MLLSIVAAFALQTSGETPAQAPAAAAVPPVCDETVHAGFDFWVGEWDVFPAGRDSKVGNSRIERQHAGCAVIENWMPLRGGGGSSLNHVDPSTGLWHQKWVGSAPGAVEFVGGPVSGGMVLMGNWPTPRARHQLIRMTYTANEDGSVRQHGEASTDHGLSWQTAFDFLYRPKATPE